MDNKSDGSVIIKPGIYNTDATTTLFKTFKKINEYDITEIINEYDRALWCIFEHHKKKTWIFESSLHISP